MHAAAAGRMRQEGQLAKHAPREALASPCRRQQCRADINPVLLRVLLHSLACLYMVHAGAEHALHYMHYMPRGGSGTLMHAVLSSHIMHRSPAAKDGKTVRWSGPAAGQAAVRTAGAWATLGPECTLDAVPARRRPGSHNAPAAINICLPLHSIISRIAGWSEV